MTKRALFFIQNGLGGAERVQIEIAQMLLSDNWMIDWAILCKNENSSIEKILQFLPDAANIVKIPIDHQIKYLKCIYGAIRKVEPSVVFASAMHVNQRILLLSKLFPKIKFIVRNDNYLYTIPKYKRITLALTYRLADKVIAQTEEMENELIGIDISSQKVVTLHNPINEKRIKDASEEKNPFENDGFIKYIGVGRITEQKGFDLLIDAFKIVVNKQPNSKLYILGDINYNNGKIYNKLIEQVKELNLEKSVSFIGFDPNPYKYIKNADVFVLSSRYEGLPNVLIEAQFLRKPSAAFTCIPIIKRIVKDGVNGYTAIPEDPQSLAEAMLNSLKLKDVEMTYAPAKKEDFLSTFNALID